MTDSNRPLQEATEIVQEHGCPICDEKPAFFGFNGGATIELGQCGHSVSIEDARIQEQLHDGVDADELQAGEDED